MKNKLTALFLVIGLISFAQNFVYVKANKLNVREKPTTKSKVIYQLKKGDSVFLVNYNEKWSEIETFESLKGYVASKFISKEPIEVKEANNFIGNIKKKKKSIIYWIIGIIAMIIIVYIIYDRYERKCDACGKWGALKVIDKEIINEKPTTVKKTLTEKVKNSKGEVIRTKEKEIVVPATKYTYKVYRKCKHCGQIYTHIETKIKEN